MNTNRVNAIIASAYNLHVAKGKGEPMTPARAANLPKGDRAALCRILEKKGGSDLYSAADAAQAFAHVVNGR